MKKLGLVAMLLLVSTSFAQVKSFPDGVYKGQGQWKGKSGSSGSYTIELTLEANHYHAVATLDRGRTIEHTGAIKFDETGFTKVYKKDDGDLVRIGGGYCGSTWCHHNTWDHASHSGTEETIVFMGNKIYRLGSIRRHKTKYMYEDELTLATP